MKLLCLNCRGLGSPRTIHKLTRLVRKVKPEILFLSETKRKASEVQVLRVRLGFVSCMVVDCVGRAGGLMMLWNDTVKLNINSYSQHHIDAIIERNQERQTWRFTGFYGQPDTARRGEIWALLKALKEQRNEPWLCAGDFNEILREEEKQGGARRPTTQMRAFQEVVDFCEFMDFPVNGPVMTWKRGSGEDAVLERLDRGLATSSWWDIFPYSREEHLPCTISDHLPILFHLEVINYGSQKKAKPFRFENMWLREGSVEEVVRGAWRQDGVASMDSFLQKVSSCSRKLMEWNKRVFGSLAMQIKEATNNLNKAWENGSRGINKNEIETCQSKLDELLVREEIKWRQRSKQLWLAEGDRNSKFFHQLASHRRRNNNIVGIKDEMGVMQYGDDHVAHVACKYFTQLFESKQDDEAIEAVVAGMNATISAESLAALECPFSKEEVWFALKQMHPSKAPGPDGLNAMFYQKFWHIVGKDTTNLLLAILNNSASLAHLNETHIVLIPKKQNASSMTDFRPISLCNVVYRLLAKVIANRMKRCLPQLVGVEQSAFLPGRSIFDNAMVAHEVIHAMKNRRKGDCGDMAIKLDISKAYDRVEWGFLRRVLTKMGFPDRWVRLLMECVSSVRYEVLINGVPYGNLVPSRGLRQGDPISPYLFILCAEGLANLIMKASINGWMHGVKVCSRGHTVSHLFFADDSLILCRAKREEGMKLKEILQLYEQASGQRINIEKSAILFSSNVSPATKYDLMSCLGITRLLEEEKYLGFPLMVGRNKRRIFEEIRVRICKKIEGWQSKLLSQAAKGVLIKFVAQAIPTYIMSCFLLPKIFVGELNSMLANFWWGAVEGKRKVHWLSWSKLCLSKLDGGQGFRDLEAFNLALLANQWWRVMHDEGLLSFQIFKARYFPTCSMHEAKVGSNPSFLWRSLMAGKKVVDKGSIWRVGSGETIRVWEDHWVKQCPNQFLQQLDENGRRWNKVAEWIDLEVRQWKRETVENALSPLEANLVLNIPLSRGPARDVLTWKESASGNLTVRSAYHIALTVMGRVVPNREARLPGWRLLWNAKTLPKIRNHGWKMMWGINPTSRALRSRGIAVEDRCPVCGEEGKNSWHAYFGCYFSKQVWSLACPWSLTVQSNDEDGQQFWERWLSTAKTKNELELALIICWLLWKNRNKCLHDGRCDRAEVMVAKARGLLEDFIEAMDAQACNLQPQPFVTAWQPPPNGTLKINVDAAVRQGDAKVGVVIREESGRVKLSATRQLQQTHDVMKAELSAILYGLELADGLECSKLIVESDSKMSVEEINRGPQSLSIWGAIIDDINYLAAKFESCVFTFVKRQANAWAHAVAHAQIVSGTEAVWLDSMPAECTNII